MFIRAYAGSGKGNAAYTRAAAGQYQRQFGGTMANATRQVVANRRGRTGAGSGRPMRRDNFVRTLPR